MTGIALCKQIAYESRNQCSKEGIYILIHIKKLNKYIKPTTYAAKIRKNWILEYSNTQES